MDEKSQLFKKHAVALAWQRLETIKNNLAKKHAKKHQHKILALSAFQTEILASFNDPEKLFEPVDFSCSIKNILDKFYFWQGKGALRQSLAEIDNLLNSIYLDLEKPEDLRTAEEKKYFTLLIQQHLAHPDDYPKLLKTFGKKRGIQNDFTTHMISLPKEKNAKRKKVPVAISDSIFREDIKDIEYPFSQYYAFGEFLGKGNYKTVKAVNTKTYQFISNALVKKENLTNTQYVQKIAVYDPELEKDNYQEWLKSIQEEIKITNLIYPDSEHLQREVRLPDGRIKVYIKSKRLEGDTLHNTLLKNPDFNISERLTIFLNIATELYKIHGKNILHRDIKPENIMIKKNLAVTFMDFGLSCKSNEGDAEAHSGTPLFMAPFFVIHNRPQPQTKKSDMYSLGVCFLLILNINLKDIKDDLRYANMKTSWLLSAFDEQFDELYPNENHLKKPIEQLLEKMLNLSPQQRPEASEVIRQLRKITTSLKITPARSDKTEQLPLPPQKAVAVSYVPENIIADTNAHGVLKKIQKAILSTQWETCWGTGKKVKDIVANRIITVPHHALKILHLIQEYENYLQHQNLNASLGKITPEEIEPKAEAAAIIALYNISKLLASSGVKSSALFSSRKDSTQQAYNKIQQNAHDWLTQNNIDEKKISEHIGLLRFDSRSAIPQN